MTNGKFKFWPVFETMTELQSFEEDALLLFALKLRFGIEDIVRAAASSLIDGSDDKKADLIYVDYDTGDAVIAQTYMSKRTDKSGAPSNKASDLNTAASWVLRRPIADLPEALKSPVEELRRGIQDNKIKNIYFWYVHNLPKSESVTQELITVEHTVQALVDSYYSENSPIQIQALEIGPSVIEDWYLSFSTPILVSDILKVPASGGYEIKKADWEAYVTSIPAKWLYEKFQQYKTKLFSANVRDYLGSRASDANINSGIKETGANDPEHFWVFNNGITALIHKLVKTSRKEIVIKGISIVNGAQTTGALGALEKEPSKEAMVQVRFVKCDNEDTIHKIVRYNNSQNKIEAPDFRSKDSIQARLRHEFGQITSVEYTGRRGGYEDVIKRRYNSLASLTAGQALAALHRSPDVAYNQKTHLWKSDTLYSRFFNEHTTAKHIFFAYSLLKAVENKKKTLLNKSKNNNLTETESEQLKFFRLRGSMLMFASAISSSLETIYNAPIPNLFYVHFKNNVTLEQSAGFWEPIIATTSAFCDSLVAGISDGLKSKAKIQAAIGKFRRLVDSTKQANFPIFSHFANQIEIKH